MHIDSSEVGLEFLAGGGTMGEHIRSHPWAETSLGDPQSWPQALRTTVRILLSTGHPTMIMWGPDLLCFYNDPFCRSLGPEKHPAILGMPARRAWEEVWPVVGAQIEQVQRGDGAVWHENVCVPIIRFGKLEEVYWTYSYSPIDEPSYPNGVGGVLVTCAETTAQVLSERKLAAERESFVQLFDQAPTFLALLRGPQHVYEMANPAYLTLLSHRDIMNRPVAEALPEAAEQGYVALLDEVYRTNKPYNAYGAKFVYQAPSGGAPEERYVDFVFQPITGREGRVTGILVQGVDMTARTTGERALNLSRARLDYATRVSGIGFWYCDLPFDELQWDERVKEHFFFAPGDRIAIDDFYARIHPEDREPTRLAIAASIAGNTQYDIVYRTVHPTTGQVKWIRAIGGTDYAPDGTPRHFDGVTVDVTAQRLDQQRLAQLNAKLREEDQRKDEFIATLSHELRNPLAPIRAAAKVLASPAVTPEQMRHAQMIVERQVNHMSLLLEDLLDIARITQGKLQLKRETIALVPVVDAAVEAVRPTLEAKNQELEVSLPSEAVLLDADYLRLSQVISNLLMNAIKYSDPGSQISLTGRVQGASLALTVRDNGIGIAPDSLARIFEMFSQVDSMAGRTEGGLGIGLALVKGIVNLHDGHVEARSDGLGKGSEFTVRLPLAIHVSEAAAPVIVNAQTLAAGRRVLIADDNRDAAESLAMLLELAGHEVRVADHGRAALAVAQVFRPDMAVLDIGMPDMSGYEVAEALRSEPWSSGLTLIALTGWGQDSDRRRAIDAGFDHHLIKPVDPDRLAELIVRGE
jgi:signal transduction histidine kinase